MRAAVVAVALALCGCYVGGAEPFTPGSFGSDPGWDRVAMPVITQDGEYNCGAAAVAMLLGYWGRPTDQDEVRTASGVPLDRGLRAEFVRSYLRVQGLDSALFEGTLRDLEHELKAGRPVLVGVRKPYLDRKALSHFLVVVGYNRNLKLVVVIDPADGWSRYSFAAFVKEWEPTHRLMLTAFPSARLAKPTQASQLANDVDGAGADREGFGGLAPRR